MRRFMISPTMRRYGSLIVATAITGVLLPLPLALQHTALADGSLKARQNISSSSDNSEAPSLAYGNGQLAATWGERGSSTVKVAGADLGGKFGESGSFKSGTDTQYQWPDITVDSSGTKHLVYAAGNTIYYRKKPAGGSWSSAKKIASDDKPNPVRMAQAPNGTLWVVWRDTEGKHIGFRYSDNGGEGWSGGSAGGIVASEDGNMHIFDVAVGTDNIPHIVWYIRTSGSYKGEIHYADWNGSKFTTGNVTNDGTTLYDADPTLVIDSNNVQHLAWRKQLGEDRWGIMYARRNTGSGWSDFTTLATTNGDAKYVPGIGTDASGSLYVAYSNPNGDRRTIKLYAKPSNASSWSSQTVSSGRWDYRPSIVGTTTNGLEAHLVYQQDDKPDEGEIIYLRYSFGGSAPTPTPIPPVNADITINNGAAITNSSSVIVTFQNVTGTPTQVRWKWGSAPTDASTDSGGWVAYSSTMTVALPASVSACADQVLYMQAKSAASTDSTPGTATIKYDNAVQAATTTINPHGAVALSTYGAKASGGDNDFTREGTITLRVINVNDCSGLKSYTIGSGATTAWVSGAAYADASVTVPSTGTQGQKSATGAIVDNQNASLPFTQSYYYDTTAPSVQATGTVTSTSGNSLVQHLTFSGVDVSDSTYQSATGKPFWGIWVASSTTAYATDADLNADTALLWAPIKVANPGASFSVDYSLATGRTGENLTAAPSYIYVKFLDGAGNPTTQSLFLGPITLSTGYSTPAINIPIINR